MVCSVWYVVCGPCRSSMIGDGERAIEELAVDVGWVSFYAFPCYTLQLLCANFCSCFRGVRD
jgi:hypothetical protein